PNSYLLSFPTRRSSDLKNPRPNQCHDNSYRFRYDECSIFYKLLSGKARNKTGDKPYYKKDEHADTDDREPTIPCLCVRRQILWHGKNADANHHRRDRDHNFPLRNGFITMCKFFHTLCPSLISRFFILCLHIFRSPVD